MAGSDEKNGIRLGPWARGIDNRSDQTKIYTVADDGTIIRNRLLDAVNVDLDNDGVARRRSGFTTTSITSSSHSLFSTKDHQRMFAVVGGDLYQYEIGLSGTLVQSGIGDTRVAYTEFNGEVYIATPAGYTAVVSASGAVRPWGVEAPPYPPSLSLGSGGIREGNIQVYLTYVTDTGEESGASRPAYITATDSSSVIVSNIASPTQSNVTKTRVYMTSSYGSTPMLAAEIPTNLSSYTISSLSDAPVLETIGLQPPERANHLGVFAGFILLADGNLLYRTEPFRPGSVHYAGFIQFDSEITMIWGSPQNTGVYVGLGDRLLFFSGRDIASADVLEVLNYGVVPYSMTETPDGTILFMTERGICEATADGTVRNHTEDLVAVPRYLDGAALYREADGIRQYVGVFRGGETSLLATQDYFDAEVIRSTT